LSGTAYPPKGARYCKRLPSIARRRARRVSLRADIAFGLNQEGGGRGVAAAGLLHEHLANLIARLAKQPAHFAFRHMHALHSEEAAVVTGEFGI